MKLSDIKDGTAFMCLCNIYVKCECVGKNCYNPIDGIFYQLNENELVSVV